MDRYTIAWTGGQIDQLSGLADMGKPTILLQMGDQLDDTPFLSNPNISAILWAGYPGQDGGTALMNVVTGKVAPAGRLPVTQYPAEYVHQVPMTDMNLRPNATSGSPGRTYKWFGDAVQPFGYGLHYTNFSLGLADPVNQTYDITALVTGCTEKYLDLCPFATFAVNVTNIGSVTSDFVALGFVAGEYGPTPYPIKQLVAYERLFGVKGGETATANLTVNLGGLARYDEEGNAVLFPGKYSMMVDVPEGLVVGFELTGMEVVLDQWPERPSSG